MEEEVADAHGLVAPAHSPAIAPARRDGGGGVKLGIDFGTTNSAVSVRGPDGRPRIVELAPGERVQRSVIFCDPDGDVHFGNAAFAGYVAADLRGRLLRSLKAFLPHDVPKTTLGRQRLSFTELVAAYLQFVVRRAEEVLGDQVTEVVVGRPVRFHRDPDKDATGERRLREAIDLAGLSRCTLQLEPVAAAHRYEQGLTDDRTVLVGDFGGGTADFAVLRVGPGRVGGDRLDDILGTSGVARAGDALDARFMATFLMRYFGEGAKYEKRYSDAIDDWSHPIQRKIQRLYYLHLLREPDLRRRLERMEGRLTDPTVIPRLLQLVFDDLGYPMAWAIEQAKEELSRLPEADFRFAEFDADALNIETRVDVARFAAGSRAILDAYREAILLALDQARIAPAEVDDVFLTGGTSQLPFIRGLFAELLGEDKLRSGDSLTSVCEGLALC